MRKVILSGVFAAILAVTFIRATVAPSGYKVGDIATDFKLKNVDGKMVSMADNASAKGYIIAFTCNTCPVAKQYEDRVVALHQKYAANGFPVIAIQPNDPGKSPGDSYAEMQKRAQEKSYPFAYLMDETQEISRTYGATNTPHMFVVKREGNQFRVVYIGAIDNNQRNAAQADKKYVENAIDELIANKPVSVPTAKAIGCGIKWKEA